MDPQKSLEGFRVDTSLPKKKEKPLPVPQQTYKKGNAILIILFATMIGLTTGIGSAFAFGVKEMPPSSYPLDEPSAKSHIIDQNEPSIKQSEIKTSELSPLKPPIDEPKVEEKSPIDEPITDEEKTKDSTPPVTKHKEVESKNSEKSKEHKETGKTENSKNSHSSVEEKPKATEPKSSNQKVPSETPTSPKSSTDLSNKETSSSSSSEVKPKTTIPSAKKETDNKTIQNNSVSVSLPHASDTNTQDKSKSASSDQIAVSSEEVPDPKTKPGTLPETAGNDLNHAVASLVLVCFSIAYLLAKKETHPEK